MKRTKIIATISDINYSEEQIIWLYGVWANVLRFNFSHATHKSVSKILKLVKKLNLSWKTNLSTLLDTKWPEIRTHKTNDKISIQKWEYFNIFVEEDLLQENTDILCDYEYLIEDAKIDQTIIIDSWLLKTKIIEIHQDHITVEALNTHVIWSKRHINLPWIKLKLPWITNKDREDIIFAIENNMDFIAASFIRSKSNILEIKALLKSHNAEHIQIISKIENEEALENIEEITKSSDGIMVARWDLWVEIKISKLPFYQKEIMDVCFKYWKTIIIATELLKSMVHSPFPTRAEVSDVYNSVILRTDCVMLSDETAIGSFPIQSCQMMNEIIMEAESHTNNKHKDFEITFTDNYAIDKKMIAKNALFIADEIKADYILVFTNSWFLARIISAFKPNHKVFAFTKEDYILRSINILYSMSPFLINKWWKTPLEDEKNAISILLKKWLIKQWHKIVIINDLLEWNAISPYVKIVNL